MHLLSKNRKIRATQMSMTVATSLALIKIVTAFFTGSMALLASAVDSLLDIVMSLVNFLAVKQAEKPADDAHPYGHGKFETLATLFQSIIIILSGGFVLFESVRRLLDPVELNEIEGGISVLLLSAGASWLVTRYLKRTAKETESPALQADSLHYAMDVYTNLGLLAGLLIIQFTGAAWVDPLLSLLVGLYIMFEAYDLIKHSMKDVLDEELPRTVTAEVESLINAHKHQVVGFHNLRTRRAGSQKIMDFHLTVCKEMTVEEAHAITDHLEARIGHQIRNADVMIHIEPCKDTDCPGPPTCPAKGAPPKQRLKENRQNAHYPAKEKRESTP